MEVLVVVLAIVTLGALIVLLVPGLWGKATQVEDELLEAQVAEAEVELALQLEQTAMGVTVFNLQSLGLQHIMGEAVEAMKLKTTQLRILEVLVVVEMEQGAV